MNPPPRPHPAAPRTLDGLLPFLGLRGKLLVAFVGLAVGPLVVLGLIAARSGRDALLEANERHLRAQLQSNVAHVEGYLALIETSAQIIAGLVGQDGPGLAGDNTHLRLQQFAAFRPDLYQVRLLDAAGMERVRVNRHGDRLEDVGVDALQDKSDRYYFRDAIALPAGVTYFSPMDLNVEHGEIESPEQLVFRVAHQVRSADGAQVGLLVLNVYAREVLDRIKLLRAGPPGDVLLVGEEGRVVREVCEGSDCRYALSHLPDALSAFSPEALDSMLRGETQVMVEGDGQFLSYAPIQVGTGTAGPRWHLAVLHPSAVVLGAVDRMTRGLWVASAASAAVALALAMLATRALSRPVRAILGFVDAVGSGDFDRALVVETRDEIEELAIGIRRMARSLDEARGHLLGWNAELQAEVGRRVAEVEALLESKHAMERQLRQADRLASLGVLSASLAHEIGNPLAGMKTAIQIQLRDPDLPAPTRELLDALHVEVDRLAGILAHVTGLVAPAPDLPAQVTVGDVYRRVAFLVEREARRKGQELRLQGDAAEDTIRIDPHRLEQVLLNLLMNALQAATCEGAVTVRVTEGDGHLVVEVMDTGPGIPPAVRDHVFDPFFTTRPDGTGLGLPIVRQLVQELGGDMTLACPEEGGTLVRIRLPRDADARIRVTS